VKIDPTTGEKEREKEVDPEIRMKREVEELVNETI
jgi:hypothetical protein